MKSFPFNCERLCSRVDLKRTRPSIRTYTYIDASDNYEFNSRERFARFSVFNSSVAKGAQLLGWLAHGDHGTRHYNASQPRYQPSRNLSPLSTRGSQGLLVCSFRFVSFVSFRSSVRLYVLRSLVHSFVLFRSVLFRSFVRSLSVSSSACTSVCYPTFFPLTSLYTPALLFLS